MLLNYSNYYVLSKYGKLGKLKVMSLFLFACLGYGFKTFISKPGFPKR